VLADREPAPVNVTACWNDGSMPEDYVTVAGQVGVSHFLVPPIPRSESAGCHHLMFDFFRDSWMATTGRPPFPSRGSPATAAPIRRRAPPGAARSTGPPSTPNTRWRACLR
jgi:hypothetical protein